MKLEEGKKVSEYFDNLLKVTGNEYGSKVSDGIEAGDVSTYVDTGSYILNALIRRYLWRNPFKQNYSIGRRNCYRKNLFCLGHCQTVSCR